MKINKWCLSKGENSKLVVPFHRKHDFLAMGVGKGRSLRGLKLVGIQFMVQRPPRHRPFNHGKWRKQIYIHKNISRQRRDLRPFFFFCVVNRELRDSRMRKWAWERNVFTVIRYWDDCSVYTTCECAFPQRRRNYANDSIFANKLENFLENPRDEGVIIKESYFRKDLRYAFGSQALRIRLFWLFPSQLNWRCD